jgi:hypothetical protein
MRLVMAGLLSLLIMGAWLQGSQDSAGTLARHPVIWYGFLYAIPAALAGPLLAGQRWALMGVVMYGTIGLALDISTGVQEVIHATQSMTLWLSSATGLINFLLIVLGGREFLGRGQPPSRRADPTAEC